MTNTIFLDVRFFYQHPDGVIYVLFIGKEGQQRKDRKAALDKSLNGEELPCRMLESIVKAK